MIIIFNHRMIVAACLVIIFACLGAGCSQENTPMTPPLQESAATAPREWGGMHYLWSWNLISIDAERQNAEIIPVRQAGAHWNVLKWLEQGPCTNCVKILSLSPSGTGTLYVNLEIKHPFSNKNLTGFDVRGIAMFNASRLLPATNLNISDRTLGDGELVNASGYTTLYNSSTLGSGPQGLEGYIKGKMATIQPPNGLLNGYKYHCTDSSDNTRNAFYAGNNDAATYEIDMPDGPFVFGYAVDASWAPPVNKPVNDPMVDFGPEANCPEAYFMLVYTNPVGGGLNEYGGELGLEIQVYDWQGPDKIYPVLVECPELFDGFIQAHWIEDKPGYSIYKATISNKKGALAGNYRCLIGKRAAEYNPSKPWLDLTAYALVTVEVKGSMIEITPPDLNFGSYDVDVKGNYAYVAAAINGLHIFNIENPAAPEWVKRVALDGNAKGIDVVGGYAYVSLYYNGLSIIDIDPVNAAHEVKKINIPGPLWDIKVRDGYAYCAAGDQGLKVVDIDPIKDAALVAEIAATGYAVALDVNLGYAYLAASDAGVVIIDIDPLGSASVVHTVDTQAYAQAISVANGYAYVSDHYSGLQILDIDPPATAFIVNSVLVKTAACGIASADGYAYVGDGNAGLTIIDVDPPGSASILCSVDLKGYATNVCLSGDYAYVANTEGGLRVVDINPPGGASLVASLPTPGNVTGIVVSGGYAYLANNHAGALVIDVDPVSNTKVAAVIDSIVSYTTGYATGITKSGNLLFVTIAWGGFSIVDVSTPTTPIVINTVGTPSLSHAIEVSGDYAYIANYLEGLQIADINPPGTASIVKSVDTPGAALDVSVAGGYAYVADGDQGLQIIDVEPIGSAAIVANVPLAGYVKHVTYSGGYAFVATGSDGLYIVDVDPPASAYFFKTVATNGGASDVAVIPGYAVVADNWNGIQLVDIDPIEDAAVVAGITTERTCETVWVDGNFAYAGSYDGLTIVKL